MREFAFMIINWFSWAVLTGDELEHPDPRESWLILISFWHTIYKSHLFVLLDAQKSCSEPVGNRTAIRGQMLICSPLQSDDDSSLQPSTPRLYSSTSSPAFWESKKFQYARLQFSKFVLCQAQHIVKCDNSTLAGRWRCSEQVFLRAGRPENCRCWVLELYERERAWIALGPLVPVSRIRQTPPEDLHPCHNHLADRFLEGRPWLRQELGCNRKKWTAKMVWWRGAWLGASTLLPGFVPDASIDRKSSDWLRSPCLV